MNEFRHALAQRQFVYSVELVLGRDHSVPEMEQFLEDARTRADGVRVMSVTDLPGGRPALPPEFVMASICERGLTPIAHLTGKDGNRNFLEGRLHGLARTGIENILALTGDAPREGFEGLAKPVYDLDSVLMLQLIAALRAGLSGSDGKQITTPFDFFPGAVVNPYKVREPDQMMQLYKLELKIASGAQFIITQLGFNIRKLYELKQYMTREGLDTIPVIANVYVPTATIGRMMRDGTIAGCVVSEGLVDRLSKEKKPQRLERAALMVAAAKALGFAGAHIGGFGLAYRDVAHIIERAEAIGGAWTDRIDELMFEMPDEFYLFPRDANGLSDGAGAYQIGQTASTLPWPQQVCLLTNRLLVSDESAGAQFLRDRLGVDGTAPEGDAWRHGFWYEFLRRTRKFKKRYLGCVSCGDCIQDHLTYAGCTMGRCYKELRNGPCGGSRVDGTCEVKPDQSCVWNLAYQYTLAAMQDPRKFARTLIPPRDWSLYRTNSLANRLAGVDNYHRRKTLTPDPSPTAERREQNEDTRETDDADHRRTD